MKNRSEFFRYVAPAVLAFAISGVYCIVDGFFIGHALGDDGLAAITIAYPVVAFIQAAGTGLGLAGAIRYTLLDSQGRKAEAGECFAGTSALLIIASALMTGVFLLAAGPILRVLGASGNVYVLAREYLRVIAVGALFQTLATGLVPFIRNLGGAQFAMVTMSAGFIVNVALDYVFVWRISAGMAGAAWATVTGQAVTMLAAAGYLIVRRARLKCSSARGMLRHFAPVLVLSLSPFGQTLSPQITSLFMNRFLTDYGDERAVAVYGCITYVTCVVYLLLQGVGDGCQPLLSRRVGEGDGAGFKYTRRLAIFTALGLAVASAAASIALSGKVGVLFGASGQTIGDTARLLPIYAAALPFVAYTRVTAAGLYAAGRALPSYALVYGEPVLTLVFLALLPGALGLGLEGVWPAVPAAQAGAAVIAAVMWARTASDYK